MVDISYAPAFHHTDWVDRVDRVEAAGPNGFNNRFNAIHGDLTQFATVVTQIGQAIDEVHTAPPPQTRLSFVPRFRPVPPTIQWSLGGAGTVGAASVDGRPAVGVTDLTLPARVNLTSIRLVGRLTVDFGGSAQLAISLAQSPLSDPSGTAPVVATMTVSGSSSFDESATVQAPIDPTTFRYLLKAQFAGPTGPLGEPAVSEVVIEAMHLTFTPA